MRVACKSCRSNYTIEDELGQDAPMGGQCPYCGHVQLVPDSGAPQFGMNAKPRLPQCTVCDHTLEDNFDVAIGLCDEHQRDRSAGAKSDPTVETSSDVKCKVCGDILGDEFDMVIGLCDRHQRDAQSTREGTNEVQAVSRSRSGVGRDETLDDSDRAHFKEVYERFVEVRRRIGENSGELAFDRFLAKLTRNRDDLIKKHSCCTVRFQVYEKDGKAALKATPILAPTPGPVALPASARQPRLGELLLAGGAISHSQLEDAVRAQSTSGGRLGSILIEHGSVNEETLTAALARLHGVPIIQLEDWTIEPAIIRLLPASLVAKHSVLPICTISKRGPRLGSSLVVATGSPNDVLVADELRFVTGYDIAPVIAGDAQIRAQIEAYYPLPATEPDKENSDATVEEPRRVANVFLSYAREDLAVAEEIVRVLERDGHIVFWDRRLLAGHKFDEVIQHELDQAECVVVLWSSRSVTSRWVKDEANEGAEREILVPILIGTPRLPLSFRSFQSIPFAVATADSGRALQRIREAVRVTTATQIVSEGQGV